MQQTHCYQAFYPPLCATYFFHTHILWLKPLIDAIDVYDVYDDLTNPF